jgi:hypothetical protein
LLKSLYVILALTSAIARTNTYPIKQVVCCARQEGHGRRCFGGTENTSLKTPS